MYTVKSEDTVGASNKKIIYKLMDSSFRLG